MAELGLVPLPQGLQGRLNRTRRLNALQVRFGSLADVSAATEFVRFVPIADMPRRVIEPTLAKPGRGLTPLAAIGITVCYRSTWNESISAEPAPKAVGTEIR